MVYLFAATCKTEYIVVQEKNQKRKSGMKLMLIIFAIFIPPLAAALQVGITTHFWINLILTLIGGIPGMIHALWLVLTNQKG